MTADVELVVGIDRLDHSGSKGIDDRVTGSFAGLRQSRHGPAPRRLGVVARRGPGTGQVRPEVEEPDRLRADGDPRPPYEALRGQPHELLASRLAQVAPSHRRVRREE